MAVTDAAGIEQVSAHARYTRAFEVKILEELPVSRLFGERGEAVCSVIARSDRLELPQVHLLAGARHPDASKAYSRAWDKWLAEVGGTGAYEGEDLQGALAISAGGSQSPINHGLIVLHHTVFNRAKTLVGSSAFMVDDDGTPHLEPTWAAASHALLEAAMALGAPFVSDADRRIMTAAWYSVFQENP